MTTPFDEVIEKLKQARYHKQRNEDHSDIVSLGVLRDLLATCAVLKADFDAGVVRHWLNVPAPGARKRRIDLLVGEPASGKTEPDVSKARICIENKSVITAHRNRYARFDDLNETMQVIEQERSEAVTVATVLVGVARRLLNVPDGVKAFYEKRGRREEFEAHVLPRLSSGDVTLWDEFPEHVSKNSANDPSATVAMFRQLPTRPPGLTHLQGYDYVMLVPVHIDNVSVPYVVRDNDLGLDVDGQYGEMLSIMCKAYLARWHL